MERKDSFEYHSDLILKYLSNSLSVAEQEDFENWLNESPSKKDLVESFRDTKKIQLEIDYINSLNINDAWKNVANQLSPKPVKLFSLKNVIKYGSAAVLILSFALGTYWFISNKEHKVNVQNQIVHNIPAGKKIASFQSPNGEIINLSDSDLKLKSSDFSAKNGTIYFAKTNQVKGNNIVRTPKAGEYKMVLPDGTNVWLNALSTLSFSNDFNKTDRKVLLKGEAYFEVAHNKAVPFIVSFSNTEVEVLGTHFNINTYNKKSKTTLLQGSVKITEGSNQKLLKPGEEATITDNGIAVAQVDTYQSIAWKEGLFLFEQENMMDILGKISRWYDVQIKYDGKPHEKKYSGNIRRQASLNQVLEMLTTVSGNKFTLTDRTLTVKF